MYCNSFYVTIFRIPPCQEQILFHRNVLFHRLSGERWMNKWITNANSFNAPSLTLSNLESFSRFTSELLFLFSPEWGCVRNLGNRQHVSFKIITCWMMLWYVRERQTYLWRNYKVDYFQGQQQSANTHVQYYEKDFNRGVFWPPIYAA